MKWIVYFFPLVLIACSGGATQNLIAGQSPPSEKTDTAQALSSIKEAAFVVLNNPERFPEVPLAPFRELVQSAHFLFQESVVENGKEVDSANDGANVVFINRNHWRAQKLDEFKIATVLHELLRILKVEEKTKWISNRVLSFENRFAEASDYQCKGTHAPNNCILNLVFNAQARIFEVRDQGCGSFPSATPVKFYGSGRVYNYCESEEANSQPSNCAIQPGKWHQLIFGDEFNFSFEGNGSLTCKPNAIGT